MIRAGRGPFKNNVSEGGLHIHHAVPGLLLLITGAFMSVGTGSEVPWAEISGVMIGIGTSLVLDEFALILHLQDVYWADEGRVSVEMVSLAVACLGLALVGVNPFDFTRPGHRCRDRRRRRRHPLHLVFIVASLYKGKYKMTLFGIFIPLVAIVAAIRLARPNSRWAKRWYSDARRDKATRRAAKSDARWRPITGPISDFIAGKPSEPDPEPSTT